MDNQPKETQFSKLELTGLRLEGFIHSALAILDNNQAGKLAFQDTNALYTLLNSARKDAVKLSKIIHRLEFS